MQSLREFRLCQGPLQMLRTEVQCTIAQSARGVVALSQAAGRSLGAEKVLKAPHASLLAQSIRFTGRMSADRSIYFGIDATSATLLSNC
jgi:hypothetical protein